MCNGNRTDQAKRLILTRYINNPIVVNNLEIRTFFYKFEIAVNSLWGFL